MRRQDRDVRFFNDLGRGHLPDHLGIVITRVDDRVVEARLDVSMRLMAPNGFLHGGTVVSLADTIAGYGCVAHLPEGATGFTTVELKANFLGTAREGTLFAEARGVHLGRTTHIWDATVWGEAQRAKCIALFRCTQLVLQR